MNRPSLAQQLMAAELELRQAQDAVRQDVTGARERYAQARAALVLLETAVERELLLSTAQRKNSIA